MTPKSAKKNIYKKYLKSKCLSMENIYELINSFFKTITKCCVAKGSGWHTLNNPSTQKYPT